VPRSSIVTPDPAIFFISSMLPRPVIRPLRRLQATASGPQERIGFQVVEVEVI